MGTRIYAATFLRGHDTYWSAYRFDDNGGHNRLRVRVTPLNETNDVYALTEPNIARIGLALMSGAYWGWTIMDENEIKRWMPERAMLLLDEVTP